VWGLDGDGETTAHARPPSLDLLLWDLGILVCA
jgi:hypothetical protein